MKKVMRKKQGDRHKNQDIGYASKPYLVGVDHGQPLPISGINLDLGFWWVWIGGSYFVLGSSLCRHLPGRGMV